jgi:hypothetical protein
VAFAARNPWLVQDSVQRRIFVLLDPETETLRNQYYRSKEKRSKGISPMKRNDSRVCLITGASTGIGRELAKAVLAKGIV